MNKANRKVIGKYRIPEDVRATLQRLERDGYKREDVTLYTNNHTLQDYEEEYDVDMLSDKTVEVNGKSNESFWERVKDMVSYDKEEDYQVNGQGDDIPTTYKEDIEAGYTIIAVREGIIETGTNPLRGSNEAIRTKEKRNEDPESFTDDLNNHTDINLTNEKTSRTREDIPPIFEDPIVKDDDLDYRDRRQSDEI